MKKLNVLTRMLLLVALLVGSVSAWGADETITFSTLELSNGVQYTSFDGADYDLNFSLAFGDGGNDGKYYDAGAAIRVYGGGHMTVSSSKTIKKIELTFGSGDGSNAITTDVNTYSNGTWTGNSKSVTFNVGGTSGHRRIASVAVTYAQEFSITVVSNDEDMGTVSGTTTITASPKDGYRVKAGSEGYTVTSGSATVTNNGDNTFTVSPTSDCTVRINFEAIPVHTLSSAINTVGAGTVTLESTSIGEGLTTTATAAANAGYKFTGWSITGTGASLSSTSTNPTTVTMGTSDATITANFEAVTTYAISWSVNGVDIGTDNVEENTEITFPDNISDIDGNKFLGWSVSTIDGITTTEPSFVSSATSTSDRTYYAVFGEVVENIPASWTLTDLSDMESSDIFVFSNGTYAMNNDNGASNAPATNSITVSENKITSEVADNLKWNVSGDAENGYTFYPNGVTDKWLYCNTTASSKSNDNIRVGIGDRKKWVFDTNGYLVTNDNNTDRYLSIYNNQDFRGYTSTGNGAFVPKFYKYIAASEVYGNWRTTVTVPVTITSAGRATFSSTNALDFTGADVEAYIAKSTDGSNVTFTSVNVVPANTGLLVKGNEGTYYIPVTTASTDDVSANKMQSTASAAHNVTSEEYGKAFVFGKKGDEIGFFKAAIGKTVAQGKSYLLLDTAPAKDVEFIDIIYDNETEEQSETTSISDELRAKSEDTPAYNLAGQKVGKDYKGIVVINGHKVIRK